jgi:hypothetical protein
MCLVSSRVASRWLAVAIANRYGAHRPDTGKYALSLALLIPGWHAPAERWGALSFQHLH